MTAGEVVLSEGSAGEAALEGVAQIKWTEKSRYRDATSTNAGLESHTEREQQHQHAAIGRWRRKANRGDAEFGGHLGTALGRKAGATVLRLLVL